jgi:hypothetical protein
VDFDLGPGELGLTPRQDLAGEQGRQSYDPLMRGYVESYLRSMSKSPRIQRRRTDEEDRPVLIDCQLRISQVSKADKLLKKFAGREGKKVPGGLF